MAMTHLPQAVVACAIGQRLQAQRWGRWMIERRGPHGSGQAAHGVHDHRGADAPRLDGQLTGHLQHLQSQLARQEQPFDERSIALGRLQQALAHHPDGGRSVPLLKGDSVTQGTRFTLQDRQVVPRVANQLLTTKATDRLSHHLTVSHEAQGRGGEAH